MIRFKAKVNATVLPLLHETQAAAHETGRLVATTEALSKRWVVSVKVIAVDQTGEWTIERFAIDREGREIRPTTARRARSRPESLVSRCSGSTNGLHQDGVRCGSCDHQHCRTCASCVRCERNHGRDCDGLTPFNGEQGRRVGAV